MPSLPAPIPLKHFAIVANTTKEGTAPLTKYLYRCLTELGATISADEKTADILEDPALFSGERPDCVIAIGGDGTILHLVDYLVENNLPVLGINLGHVGFLSEVEPSEIETACRDLIAGRYYIDRRTLLSGSYQKQSSLALNEFLFYKEHYSRTIEVCVEVDRQEVSCFSADGVLVSTPTGSSAYSLSAGGPLVAPDVPAILITPVAAHSLTARPMLFRNDVEVRLRLMNDRYNTALVCADGKSVYTGLHTDDLFCVNRSEYAVNFLRLHTMNYCALVKQKLGS